MVFPENLIRAVKAYPCLWNKSTQQFKNQGIQDHAWRRISIKLKKTVEELKVEWSRLRESHRRALQRRTRKRGCNYKKMRAWKYQEQMSFLLTDLAARKIQPIGVGDHRQNENILESIIEENEEETGLEIPTNLERERKMCRKDITKFKKSQLPTTFLHDTNKDKNSTRELDLFFASACESTKRLSRYLQLKVKAEVMNAVINAEKEFLDHEQIATFTSSNSCQYSQRETPASASQTLSRAPETSTSSPAILQVSTSSPHIPQTSLPSPPIPQTSISSPPIPQTSISSPPIPQTLIPSPPIPQTSISSPSNPQTSTPPPTCRRTSPSPTCHQTTTPPPSAFRQTTFYNLIQPPLPSGFYPFKPIPLHPYTPISIPDFSGTSTLLPDYPRTSTVSDYHQTLVPSPLYPQSPTSYRRII